MDSKDIINKMNTYIHYATISLSDWLMQRLPKISDNWWNECVYYNLTEFQKERVEKENITELKKHNCHQCSKCRYICCN